MGRGDNIMATGLARGAAARGKRIAFGDGRRITWDQHSKEIFRGNPNIAPPGSEADPDLEWIDYRTGHRIYNKLDRARRRWIWNMDFRPVPGELFFDEHELAWAAGVGAGFVLMEPNVEAFKTWASNKRWPADRYDAVAARLAADGAEIVQFAHGDHRIGCARQVRAPSFRHAMAALARASLYVGPEGGMHHGAAAVGVPGVVLFGGFIPPEVTGYAGHFNLTGGAKACGSLRPCAHCRAAMQAIRVEDVTAAAQAHLTQSRAA
ncbi:glycosyltransferase family 9 protein [Mesorhizobium sp.]|uniref:glycosyltransferase family 9 protein n=1 Tax=Mesorhizobium sp. TaxID=1871066 RepID=UPI000FEA1920|nr:glycosyltransferase family 9 protein [Mesorhizobium sp.]RWO23359.1 MAG: hypothetical protein EOS09_17190 [Mesorhizobium sp.]